MRHQPIPTRLRHDTIFNIKAHFQLLDLTTCKLSFFLKGNAWDLYPAYLELHCSRKVYMVMASQDSIQTALHPSTNKSASFKFLTSHERESTETSSVNDENTISSEHRPPPSDSIQEGYLCTAYSDVDSKQFIISSNQSVRTVAFSWQY